MGKAGLRDRTRHSPDRAGRLILGDNRAAVFTDDTAACEAVVAHASENDCENTGAEDLHSASEKDVDSGTAMIFRRFLVEAKDRDGKGVSVANLGIGRRGFHMPVSAGDVDGARADWLAVCPFADTQRAAGVETLREEFGK